MSGLKKCPFCGGEAILESDIIGKGKELWYVSCKSDCVTQYGYCTTKERAIENWNTRRPIERIMERLGDAKKNICGSYNYKTPLLENPSHKIAFNNGIEKSIEIIKEGLE